MAAFHEERLAQLGARQAPDVAVDLDGPSAARAIRDGTPLLGAGGLSVDTGEVLEELHRLAANLAETAELDTPAQRTARSLARAPLELGPLLQPLLSGDVRSLEHEAIRLQADPAAFTELCALAIQPALWEAAARLATLADVDRWERGYCPICGAWPVLAELVGSERRRVLRCVRCGVAWSWLVLLCPYCGNDDHRTLGTLASAGGSAAEAGGERVDVCERCHGYVKAVSTFASHAAPRLIAEDVATLHLDVAARDAGYRRPGEVDV
ncbi:MAG: formate dehydrogenase accessory protein FdhE, partial [Candidatus Limnocylindria bacterium]